MFMRMTRFLVLFLLVLCAFQLLVESVAANDSSTNDSTSAPTTTASCVEETCTSKDFDAITTPEAQDECGVWLALSTLPGTGIGMFAGKEYVKGDMFMAAGDHVVPIVDFATYQPDGGESFLWDEYTWVSKK